MKISDINANCVCFPIKISIFFRGPTYFGLNVQGFANISLVIFSVKKNFFRLLGFTDTYVLYMTPQSDQFFYMKL